MSTTKRPTLAQLTNELEVLRDKRANEIKRRMEALTDLRKRVDDELLVLADEAMTAQIPGQTRRSKLVIPDCGTETGYQRHRTKGENCDECKAAHAAHERVKAARRRLARMGGAA